MPYAISIISEHYGITLACLMSHPVREKIRNKEGLSREVFGSHCQSIWMASHLHALTIMLSHVNKQVENGWER